MKTAKSKLPALERVQTEDSRFYKRVMLEETRYYPSSTTILHTVKAESSFLDGWSEDQAEKLGVLGKRIQLFLDAERGTVVHEAIERWNAGEDLSWEEGRFTKEEWARICRYMLWNEETKPVFKHSEVRVYSDKLWYAGTIDGVIEREGKRYIVDFKTGKDVYPSHLLQGTSYLIAWNEMFPDEQADGVIIVALNARTKKGWKEVLLEGDELEHYRRGWLLHLDLFKWVKADFAPKLDLLPPSFSHE